MKVLTRVALGCGVLVLLGAGAAGVWLFRVYGLAREAAQRQQLQQQALQRLEERYPFTPPRDGAVLALSEERLADYLAVREASLPGLERLEARTVQLQEEQRARSKGTPHPGAALEASGTLLELATQARAVYLERLEQHRMSPGEFRALTRLVYTLHQEGLTEEKERFRAGEYEGVAKQLAQLQERMKDGSLSPEQRAALEVAESQYKAWLQRLEKPPGPVLSEEALATHQANKALVKKHRLRIAKAYDSRFDAFVHASAGEEAGRQEVPGGPLSHDAQ